MITNIDCEMKMKQVIEHCTCSNIVYQIKIKLVSTIPAHVCIVATFNNPHILKPVIHVIPHINYDIHRASRETEIISLEQNKYPPNVSNLIIFGYR